MKLLFDFFPIILFFIAFKVYDIYVATAVAIIASTLQVSLIWLKTRRFEFMQLLTLGIILILGSATLLFHNDAFIKWKPTAINWILAVIFFASQFVAQKPLIHRIMENNIDLPEPIWRRLNNAWVAFFTLMGGANLYVAYNFTTNAWVNFKLFGILGLTIIFVILQAIYLTRHIHENENNGSRPESN